VSHLTRLKSKPPKSDARWAYDEIIKLRRESGYMQSTIDALMLEFCPERMTREQMAVWEDHQKPIDKGYFGTSYATMPIVLEQQAAENYRARLLLDEVSK